MAKLAYAQWPWGAETKEQFVQSCKELSSLGYTYFESVRGFIDTFSGDVQGFLSLTETYNLRPISFYFHLSHDPAEDIRQLKSKIGFVQACGIKTICVQAVWRSPCGPRSTLSALMAKYVGITVFCLVYILTRTRPSCMRKRRISSCRIRIPHWLDSRPTRRI